MELKLVAADWYSRPFDQYPQLKTIWPDKYQKIAEEITNEELQNTHSRGPILLIVLDGFVVGITGAFVWPESMFDMGLRWTGVIKVLQQKGIGSTIITLLLQYLEVNDWVCNNLIEILPNDEYGNSIKPFFEKTGFVPCGELEYHDWLDGTAQTYILDRGR